MESSDAPHIYVGLNEQHNTKWVEKGWKEWSSPEFPEELKELNIDQAITNIVKETIEKIKAFEDSINTIFTEEQRKEILGQQQIYDKAVNG